jgi:hypothetical protein
MMNQQMQLLRLEDVPLDVTTVLLATFIAVAAHIGLRLISDLDGVATTAQDMVMYPTEYPGDASLEITSHTLRSLYQYVHTNASPFNPRLGVYYWNDVNNLHTNLDIGFSYWSNSNFLGSCSTMQLKYAESSFIYLQSIMQNLSNKISYILDLADPMININSEFLVENALSLETLLKTIANLILTLQGCIC